MIEYPDFKFDITHKDPKSGARLGKLKTPHGEIETPNYIFCGTKATVKNVAPAQLHEAKTDIILSNTYHLMLQPGADIIAKMGGLHKFMGWNGPMLTDSGGFQVWSLSQLRKMDADGVTFRSHIDGSEHRLTPARSIEIQADLLGADISMQLDECTDYPCGHDDAERSMKLSLDWGQRSLDAFGERETQTLFGIVQGSNYPDLRETSAKAVAAQGFGGIALGGLAVGEGHDQMCATIDMTVPHLPHDKPRYVMGVGKPIDLIEAVARGIDMFDCVLPTRAGRHGQAWTWEGPINLKNAQYAEDLSPLDEAVPCPASQDYSRAYLHHLIRSGEYLGSMVLSWHNIAFFQALMARMRDEIATGTFEAFRAEYAARWAKTKSKPKDTAQA
ncbi:MAG: tRNA guanosine(34) transglycosylase Tgt [Pseudomonadota bacterium]